MTLTSPPDQAPAPESGPARPVAAGERAALPDVLRGLALLGILIINAQDFAGFREWQQRGVDGAVQTLTDVFLNGRSISLFAMLFGWGAAGLLARHGAEVLLRRVVVLLALGTAHHVLVWHGDIIAMYALLASALLLTTRMTARQLVAVAGALGAWWLLLGLLAGFGTLDGPARPRFDGLPDLMPGMTYAHVLAERAVEFQESLIGGTLYNGLWLVALFCLGAAAGRVGLLTRPHEHLPLLRRLAAYGLMVGLPLGVLLAWLNTWGTQTAGLLAIPVRMGGGLASALGYAGVLGLLAARGGLGPLRAFAASGRLAMSNYIAQSLIMTGVFYPYAGGQFGRWGAAPAVLLALVVGLAQVSLSAWVLRRFGTGPLEALTRALVYGHARR